MSKTDLVPGSDRPFWACTVAGKDMHIGWGGLGYKNRGNWKGAKLSPARQSILDKRWHAAEKMLKHRQDKDD